MQKIFKNNKGSIALFAVLSVLFFLVIVTSVAISLKNKESAVDAQYERVKSAYEKDVGNEEFVYKNINTAKSKYKRIGNIYCNSPDLTGFNAVCTYYVTYDETGNQTSEDIPITQAEPNNWYDYENKKWANIMTNNNGNKTYWTWIPRFKYTANSGNKSTTVMFVDINDKCYIQENNKKKQIDVSTYDISDAFTFNGTQLAGYWVAKYRVQEGTNKDANVNQIQVDLSGFNPACTYYVTYDDNGNQTSENIPISQNAPNGWYDYSKKKWANIMTNNNGNKTYWTYIPRYEYHISPWKYISATNTKFINTSVTDSNADAGYSVPDSFTFNGKQLKGYWVAKYRVQEGTNNDANLNQIEVDLSGFNPACTYYVTYDDNGNQTSENIPISQNAPNGWYDYSKKKWANVVTKGKDSNNQEQITYWTYIPRYEYHISPWKYISATNIKFINTLVTDSNADAGYSVPDSFTFNGKQLKGYWVSKYRIQNGTPNAQEFNGTYYKPD